MFCTAGTGSVYDQAMFSAVGRLQYRSATPLYGQTVWWSGRLQVSADQVLLAQVVPRRQPGLEQQRPGSWLSASTCPSRLTVTCRLLGSASTRLWGSRGWPKTISSSSIHRSMTPRLPGHDDQVGELGGVPGPRGGGQDLLADLDVEPLRRPDPTARRTGE